jgi:hypothetical protein
MRHNLPPQILQFKFVEFIPDAIDEGMLYISLDYATAIHNCMCGCGNLVVTPFSPTDWKLTFDGKSVSLYPSIGNWNFSCRSHYFIRNSRIDYCCKWSDDEIKTGREFDKKDKGGFFTRWKKMKRGKKKGIR